MDKYYVIVEDRKGLQSGNDVGAMSLLTGIRTTGLDLLNVGDNVGLNAKEHSESDLEKMMVSFVKNAENRRRYRLYKLDSSSFSPQEALSHLSTLLSDRRSASPQEALSSATINLGSYLRTPTEEDIPWDYLNQLGINKEKLENSGELTNLLVRRKTNLVPIGIPFLGKTIYTEARLFLKRDFENDKFDIDFSPVKRAPQLNVPYMGHQFTPEERHMLNTMGNLGKVVELTSPTTGDTYMAYISVDPQTHDLISCNASTVHVPPVINGTELTEEQHQSLLQGEAVSLGKQISVNGTEYTSYLQVNAETRGVEFIYGDQPTLETKYLQQKRSQLKARGVPSVIGTRVLTDLQREAIAGGKTLYLKDLVNKKTGEVYSSYVKLNKATGKLQFFRFNPDKQKSTKTGLVEAAKKAKQTTEATKNNTKGKKEKRQQGLSQ